MKYGIILGFDEQSQNKINSIRQTLARQGVHDEAYHVNHVTLFATETEDENAIKTIALKVEKVAKTQRKLAVRFDSVGTFMTESNVVFFSPVMTDELKDLNKKICKKLSSFKHNHPYYAPNKWVPHSTIVLNLSDDEMLKAISVLKTFSGLPFEVEADKMVIIRYDVVPYEEVAVFELRER